MIYLIVRSAPPVLYYQGHDLSYHAEIALRYPLLQSVGRINRPINDETPNVTVTLDNGDGGLTEMLADPPIGCIATLCRADAVVFEGTIDSVTIKDTIELGIIG